MSVCPVYNNAQKFPNFYGVYANSLLATPIVSNRQYLAGYHDVMKNFAQYRNSSINSDRYHNVVFTPDLLQCGSVNDPYCPDGIGVVTGRDVYQMPTCTCAVSGRKYTSPVLDRRSAAQMASVVKAPLFQFMKKED